MGNTAVQTTPNRLLFDFYLNLLTVKDDQWRTQNQELYAATLYAISKGIKTDQETVQNIFERMSREDVA